MPGMKEYDSVMNFHLQNFKAEGISHSIFGDIFLEDLRKYREDRLAGAGLKAIFPLWQRNTTELVNEFMDLGFRTMIVCTQGHLEYLSGKEISKELISTFPPGIDICGENGEFHTFAFDGPIFKNPVAFEIGEMVFKEFQKPKDEDDDCSIAPATDERMGFWYTDLIPA